MCLKKLAMNKVITKKFLNDLTYNVIGAAIEVHKELGPGLLESVYHRSLFYEFRLRKIYFQSQLIVPVKYKEMELDAELRCDYFVENSLVVELKTVEFILPVHEAQVLTYMKLLQVPKGVILNFFVSNLYKEGQFTFVNEWYRALQDS
jgi:GxxExxY protein